MDKLNFFPTKNRLLIRAEKRDEKTEFGIYLPPSMEGEGTGFGTVLATGPGTYRSNFDKTKELDENYYLPRIAVGDLVFFDKYKGYSFELNKEEVIIMDENDILGIISKEKESDVEINNNC